MLRIHTHAWIPMVFLAIANGIARDQGYRRRMSELHAHQLSTLIALVVFTLYAGALGHLWPLASAGEAAAVGGIWLGLTIAFEVGFGRYVAGHPWRRLAMDYNLRQGRVWSVLLLWLAVLPYVVFRLRA
jgi:hypothetical protein